MFGLFVLIIIIGLFLYFIWYIFRSVLWVANLFKYFQNREAERFSIEEIDKDESDDADLESISRVK